MTLRTAPAPRYRKRQTNFRDFGEFQSMSENRREFCTSLGRASMRTGAHYPVELTKLESNLQF